MKIKKEQFTSGWSLRRVLSILFGSIIIYKAALTQEVVSAVFGIVLLAMGILNVGCSNGCCGGSCSYSPFDNKLKK